MTKEEYQAAQLEAAFRHATAAAIADLPSALITHLKDSLREAEILRFRKLIGGSPNAKITIPKINSFLKSQAEVPMDDEQKVQVVHALQHFTKALRGKLTLTTDTGLVECTISTEIRKDRGVRRFMLSEANSRRTISRPQNLPSNLQLSR